MKPTFTIILLGLLSACIIPAAIAQTPTTTHAHTDHGPLKIGTANVEYVLSNLPETKQIQSDLTTYEKQLTTQFDNKKAEYQRKMDEYQKGLSSGLMPEAVKADKEKELISMEESIQEFGKNAQQDLQHKQESMLQPVLDKIQKSIDKVAAANGYTYIFSTHSDYNGSAIVLYARNKDQDDISNLVLKDMGAPIPAPATTTTTGSSPTGTTGTTTPQTGTPVKK